MADVEHHVVSLITVIMILSIILTTEKSSVVCFRLFLIGEYIVNCF